MIAFSLVKMDYPSVQICHYIIYSDPNAKILLIRFPPQIDETSSVEATSFPLVRVRKLKSLLTISGDNN